ncbi:dna polymerase alpha catalytic [Ophiostoma piceae UAMH 11346]|uniref:DNA polymerase n=1 Tax=Ophiostoma piceae (strain UAMH 11346) TaxID=1262450 RepID=S3C066_OPHP1|nr:dna polymerase alpha catalytic [Ophiostoma piceae UAMH 11346]
MSKARDRRSKFESLRALRKSGKTAFDEYEINENNALYEEVDENQYKTIVRDRLNQDDFVVDDNGEGYADDGREEWDRAHVYESDSGDDGLARGKNRKSSKKTREDDQAGRDAQDRGIAEYFTKSAVNTQPKSKVIKTEDDNLFMNNLLGEMEPNISPMLPRMPPKKRPAEQRRVRDMSPDTKQPAVKRVRIAEKHAPPTTAADGPYADNDEFLPSIHNDIVLPSDDIPMSDPMPSSPTVRVASRKVHSVQPTVDVKEESKEDDDEEDDLMMEVAHAGAVNIASVNMASARPIKKVLKAPEPSPSSAHALPTRTPAPAPDTTDTVDTSAWTSLNHNLNLVSSPQTSMPMGKMNHMDAVEEDGSLKFFWTDYAEINNTLCLFGKVLDKKTKKHVSCFVKIDNIMRKLYFLPRETRVVDGSVTDESVGMGDVYSEIDSLMTKIGVKEHKTKPCSRKYAFELPNIPKEGRYLKLLYPYTRPSLTNTSGETFSHVFGATTALFEQFVLWKNIMGPCWLKIEDANLTSLKNASHCKLEVLAEHPNMVSVIHDNDAPDAPPLTLLSLAMRMVYHPETKKQELLAISGRVYENVGLSDTTPADKLPCRTFTVIRPNKSAFPVGFETMAGDKSRHRGFIRTARNEAELLSFFLGQVTLVDPDVIVGHQLEGVDYSVLLDRLRAHKTPQWSRIGRFKRQNWPSTINRVGGNVFAERQILSGRLLCDLANDSGRSVMLKCQSWTLTEMCSLYLGGEQNQRREVDCDAALDTWAKSASGLLDFVAHIEADTYFIAALALKVQILPLTKVLTNLAGNSWARTLTGTRAERNEYILLHEFHRNKYICPDKQTFRGRGREDDEQGEAGGEGGKKKDKYKGGLVFEPERGLYDKFVLVMDFNSLYPSIIQEYNICFTTVERSALATDSEEEAVPDVPTKQDQGILPRLISGLVSRRRQVKGLMKDKKATSEQLATWDIKQLALKLTANSMYGCLGYTKSRFYARPLAVLVTYKGREILRSTKELAEEKSLQVIYGDTDSVMINANVDDVAGALRVGQQFKKLVNDRYKLLEIDIDNIFRRILLQAKKKYAAINLIEQNGEYIEKMEVKGLDMRRREYCALSKDISTRILNEILSGNETEVSITRIHEYLREMGDKMRSGDITPATGIPASKYIIFTQLGKDPQDYPNADTMPQVQVALREAKRGKKMRKGDVVSYIIATGESAPLSEPAPKRAYTAGDLMKKESGLVPDVEWYINKQIFPPVERLCANISGTSTAQLADNLGLDTSRYDKANHSVGGGGGGSDVVNIHPLETQIPDEIRFADCARLQLRCRKCKTYQQFEGLAAAPPTEEGVSAVKVTSAGIACGKCEAPLPVLSIVAQVDHAVRLATTRYQEAWLVCDDSSCGQRTRQMGVYGTRCMGPKGLARDCMGRMRYEFSERDMYNQLVYFNTLFDVDKAKEVVKAADASKATPGIDRELILALAEHNRARFATVKRVVEQYLEKCGRGWVAMDMLFAKIATGPVVRVPTAGFKY